MEDMGFSLSLKLTLHSFTSGVIDKQYSKLKKVVHIFESEIVYYT